MLDLGRPLCLGLSRRGYPRLRLQLRSSLLSQAKENVVLFSQGKINPLCLIPQVKTYLVLFSHEKEMCFCFPQQNKIFLFVSASKTISRFLFPQLNISLGLFPQVKILLLAETKTKNMFTCGNKN